MKQFFKVFLVAFVLFMLIGTPIHSAFQKVAEVKIFGESEVSLMDELDTFVDPSSRFFQAFQDKERVNVMLLGVNGGMTDTIMVASFDMKAKHVDLISLPRDTYYYREGYNGAAEKKLNAAYRKNPLNTANAISDLLLGMPIHYYAVVDYGGVKKIVDAVGGVPMDIPFTMKYRDPYDKPPLNIYIEKGPQTLDGEHAVQFLRYRHGYKEGDLGRVKAQQEFMKSAFRQFLNSDIPASTKVIFENVDSDINLGISLKIATKAVGMSPDSISTYMLPNTPDPEPPYYVYPKTEEIADMLTEIYSIEPEDEAGSEDGDSQASNDKKKSSKPILEGV